MKSGPLYYSLFIYQVLCCDWSVMMSLHTLKESNSQQRWHRSYVAKGVTVQPSVLMTVQTSVLITVQTNVFMLYIV